MTLAASDSTNSSLLRDVSDWEDYPAWVAFQDRYDPLLRRWCRSYGLDDDSADEVLQRIWIELADRMQTFQYDPNRTFRGWLRRLCESRTVDFLRRRQATTLLSLDDREGETESGRLHASPKLEDDESDPRGGLADLVRCVLIDEANQIQAAVRAQVKPSTWEAFWLVAVCDWTVQRTAANLGMTHTAVYAASERVARRLRDEGKRVIDRLESLP